MSDSREQWGPIGDEQEGESGAFRAPKGGKIPRLRTPNGSLRERWSEKVMGFTGSNRNKSHIHRLTTIHHVRLRELQIY
jgi:hypothetical protein